MRKLLGPALAVLMVGAAPVAAQDPAELVTFDSRTYPGGLYTPFMPPPEAGSPATILGILRLPGGEARVPAVILAHGCSGLSGTEHYWARTLRDAGIATFQVNSFSGRGIASICRGTQPINMASVMTDVYRALAVLAAHPRIDGQRVALMGFSFGGRTALWASHPRFRERLRCGTAALRRPHRRLSSLLLHPPGRRRQHRRRADPHPARHRRRLDADRRLPRLRRAAAGSRQGHRAGRVCRRRALVRQSGGPRPLGDSGRHESGRLCLHRA
jgi:hypothetical protein